MTDRRWKVQETQTSTENATSVVVNVDAGRGVVGVTKKKLDFIKANLNDGGLYSKFVKEFYPTKKELDVVRSKFNVLLKTVKDGKY